MKKIIILSLALCLSTTSLAQYLAAGHYKGIKIWNNSDKDPKNWKMIKTIKLSEGVKALAFNLNSTRLATVVKKRIKIWDTSDKDPKNWNATPTDIRINQGELKGVAFSPDGTRLATAAGNFNTTMRVSDISDKDYKNWKVLTTMKIPYYYVDALAFNPDNTCLTVGLNNGGIKIFDISDKDPKNWKELRSGRILPDHAWVEALAFNRDGTRLAVGGNHEAIKILDTSDKNPKNWKQIPTNMTHKKMIKSVVFSSDDKYLASGSYDKTIKIWDTADWKKIKTIEHTPSVWSMAFSPIETKEQKTFREKLFKKTKDKAPYSDIIIKTEEKTESKKSDEKLNKQLLELFGELLEKKKEKLESQERLLFDYKNYYCYFVETQEDIRKIELEIKQLKKQIEILEKEVTKIKKQI